MVHLPLSLHADHQLQSAGVGGSVGGREDSGARPRAGGGGRRREAGPTRASGVCAPPPPRHQRAARARVYVPRGAATSAAEWQHCGDTEAQSLGDASLRHAGSSGSGRRGGAGRSARASGGGSQAAGPDHLPACAALGNPRLTSGAPQTQHRGLARGAARAGARRCRSAGLVNRSGRT